MVQKLKKKNSTKKGLVTSMECQLSLNFSCWGGRGGRKQRVRATPSVTQRRLPALSSRVTPWQCWGGGILTCQTSTRTPALSNPWSFLKAPFKQEALKGQGLSPLLLALCYKHTEAELTVNQHSLRTWPSTTSPFVQVWPRVSGLWATPPRAQWTNGS